MSAKIEKKEEGDQEHYCFKGSQGFVEGPSVKVLTFHRANSKEIW